MRAGELASKALRELEKKKLEKLELQLENCSIYAPTSGTIDHANDPRRSGINYIGIGETLLHGQIIFKIPDVTSPLGATVASPARSPTRSSPGRMRRCRSTA